MKVAILAGGRGSRISEETGTKPKPMITIGGRPILWHIMKHYFGYGYSEFLIALGYRGNDIKAWMHEMARFEGSQRFDLKTGKIEPLGERPPPWIVDLIETGLNTNTGGRIKRLEPFIGRERFAVTFGDGVSDVDLDKLLDFHISHGKLATLTAVSPAARFGHLGLDGNQITKFEEKPCSGEGWINGAFLILEPEVFDYIEGDDTVFEREPLERLSAEGQLMAYRHHGFWQCMDNIKDLQVLRQMWDSGDAPWITWS